MSVPMIKSKDEFKEITKEGFVIVDFTASWCGPCKMIGPKFEEFSKECKKLKFIKVDVDEAEEIAADCEISAMPTFKVFKDGKEADEMVGASVEKLKELCIKYDNM